MNTKIDTAKAMATGKQDLHHPDRRAFITTLGLAAGTLLTPSLGSALANESSPLERQVEAAVKRLRAKGQIRSDENTSWSVYDFNRRRKLVSINEEIPRQGASMIKPFVAQAFFYTAQDQGSRLRYSRDIRDTMEAMIRDSSNPATTEIMQIVSRYNGNTGPKATESVLKRHANGIFQQTRFVEYIPANGRTYRNQASARDYSRFLYALWKGQLPHADDILELMALPNHDRIVRGVSDMPSSLGVYDKTGSTARLCGNMGIIEARDAQGRPRPYTFIGIIEKQERTNSYTRWITDRSDAIRGISGLVYQYIRNQHQVA